MAIIITKVRSLAMNNLFIKSGDFLTDYLEKDFYLRIRRDLNFLGDAL